MNRIKDDMQVASKHMKMLNNLNHQGNTNQSHNEMQFYAH